MGGGGGIPSDGGEYLEIWVLNTGFVCVIELKLTLTLAQKSLHAHVYDFSTRGEGKPFLLL